MPPDAFCLAPSLMRALAGEPVRVGTENRAKLGAVRAALAGFAAPGVSLEVLPVGVASDVPDQPIGWAQIVAGARTRARRAYDSGPCALACGIEDGLVRIADESQASNTHSDSKRGSERKPPGVPEVFNVGCAWITDGEREGHGFSSGFAYPDGCREAAFARQEPIGDLFDALWRSRRSGIADPPHAPLAGQVGFEGGGTESDGASAFPVAATAAGAAAPVPASEEPSGRRGGNIGMLTQGRLDRSAYGAQALVCALVRFLHTDLYD